MAYGGTREEVRKKEREKKRRQRVLKKIREKHLIVPNTPEVVEALSSTTPRPPGFLGVSPWEFVRAGQVAAYLECLFRLPTASRLVNEDSLRQWLRDHPVAASIVSELLTAAGLLSDLKRWRG